MHRLIAHPLLTILHAGFFALLAGCHASPIGPGAANSVPTSSAPASTYQQLIIKFRPATFRCAPADIARLAAQINVRLELVRPMSGDACVIRQVQVKASDFAQGQKLLKQHSSVEWVELDAVMKTM